MINHFSDGIKQGEQKKFAQHGQLLSCEVYEANICTQRRRWFDTGYAGYSRIQVSEEYTEDLLGRSASIKYSYSTGKPEEKTSFDKMTNLYIKRRYSSAGKLVSENINDLKNRHAEEKQWDYDGKLILHKRWENGKYLGDKLNPSQ